MNIKILSRIYSAMGLLFLITLMHTGGLVHALNSKVESNLKFEGDEITLKTFSAGNHRFVEGSLAKKTAINIIVDTGASVNVIDQSYISKLNYKKIGETEVMSGGSEAVKVDIVIIPKVTVGALTVVNAEFITTDLRTMSRGLIDAVLGMNLFKDVLLTFDPQNDAIIIANSNLKKDDPSVLTYVKDLEGFKIETLVAGQKIIMNLDTGSPSAFTLPMSSKDSVPLEGELVDGPRARLVGGERTIKLGKLKGDIKIGSQSYKNPTLSFMQPSSPYGNIGGPILNQYQFSIDQEKGLLAFRPYEKGIVKRKVLKTGKRRLGIEFRGMSVAKGLVVERTHKGSIGEASGLRKGDKLVRLNGIAMTEYDMATLGKLFGGWEPLKIEVDRNGKIVTIDIN